MPIKCNCDDCARLVYRRSQHWLAVGIWACMGLVVLLAVIAIYFSAAR